MKPVIRIIKPTEKSAVQVAFKQGKKEGRDETLALVGSTTLDTLSCQEKRVRPSTHKQGVAYRYGVNWLRAGLAEGHYAMIRVIRRDLYGEKVLQYSSQPQSRASYTSTHEEIDESIVRMVVDVVWNIPCDAIALVWAVVPRLYQMAHHTPNPVDGHISDHCRNLIRRILSRLYNTETAELFMSQQ